MTVSLLHSSFLHLQLGHHARTKVTLKNHIATMATDLSVHRSHYFDYLPLFWCILSLRLSRYLLILEFDLNVEIGFESLSRNLKEEFSGRISHMLASCKEVEIKIADQARPWFSLRQTFIYQKVWPFLDFREDFEWIPFEYLRRQRSNLWANG